MNGPGSRRTAPVSRSSRHHSSARQPSVPSRQAGPGDITADAPVRLRDFPTRGDFRVSCSSLGHSKPHNRLFPGRLGHHPGAGCRQRRATSDCYEFLLPGLGRRASVTLFQGDGLGGLAGACVQCAGGRVKDEDDLLLAQVTDRVLGGLAADVDSAAGAPPSLPSGRPGEQQVESGQVRHDEILADVGVLRTLRAGCRGGGGRGGTGKRPCRWTRHRCRRYPRT